MGESSRQVWAGPGGNFGCGVWIRSGRFIEDRGDQLYDTTRLAWIRHRKYTMEHSKERLLDVRKPQFHPKDSTLPRRDMNIIPQDPGGDANKSKESTKTKGWFWRS